MRHLFPIALILCVSTAAWCLTEDDLLFSCGPGRPVVRSMSGSRALPPAGEEEVVLRITLVDEPRKLTRPLTYEFGLQATPVKPMPAGWRSWEGLLNNLDATPEKPGWAFFWEQWNRTKEERDGPYGYPVMRDGGWEDMEHFASRNQRPWLYWHMHALWQGDPVLKAYGGDLGGAYKEGADPFSSTCRSWLSRTCTSRAST